MIKCPRCNLEQDQSPQCEYCGLDFREHRKSVRTSKASYTKRIGLLAAILVISGTLMAAYWFTTTRPKSDLKPTIVEDSSRPVQSTQDQGLRTAAKELSGDVGIVNELTAGSNKGSIIAMIVFSIIGMGYLAYGKKSQQLLMVICGIGLMGYSYVIDGTLYVILIGLVLSALPFVLSKK